MSTRPRGAQEVETAPARSDADLQCAVERALEGVEGSAARGVGARVLDGRAILEGEVRFQTERAEAEAAVRTVAGVIGVDNRLRIVAEPALLWEARDAIEHALERRAAREAHRIHVALEGGRAVLRGGVGSPEERAAVVGAVRALRGITDVCDQLHYEV
jgi:osmotically-inducible protein OsmY